MQPATEELQTLTNKPHFSDLSWTLPISMAKMKPKTESKYRFWKTESFWAYHQPLVSNWVPWMQKCSIKIVELVLQKHQLHSCKKVSNEYFGFQIVNNEINSLRHFWEFSDARGSHFEWSFNRLSIFQIWYLQTFTESIFSLKLIERIVISLSFTKWSEFIPIYCSSKFERLWCHICFFHTVSYFEGFEGVTCVWKQFSGRNSMQ